MLLAWRMINAYSILVRKSKGNKLFGRYRSKHGGNITWKVKEKDTKLRTGFIWLRIWASCGNEPSDIRKDGEFRTQVH
jgi:hypothetical protein